MWTVGECAQDRKIGKTGVVVQVTGPAPFIYRIVLSGGAEPPIMIYRYADQLRRVPPPSSSSAAATTTTTTTTTGDPVRDASRTAASPYGTRQRLSQELSPPVYQGAQRIGSMQVNRGKNDALRLLQTTHDGSRLRGIRARPATGRYRHEVSQGLRVRGGDERDRRNEEGCLRGPALSEGPLLPSVQGRRTQVHPGRSRRSGARRFPLRDEVHSHRRRHLLPPSARRPTAGQLPRGGARPRGSAAHTRIAAPRPSESPCPGQRHRDVLRGCDAPHGA